MSTLKPYSFKEKNNQYRFQTDKGVIYSVSFTDGSIYFRTLPSHIPVYEFIIKVVELGENLSPPFDSRLEITVIEILKIFFSNHGDSIIYICSMVDNRQHSRFRKFDAWFNRNISVIPDLEKYDTFITYEDLEILSTLIVHKGNPYRETLVKMFLDQANDYEK
jgi:hypothetical protein